MQIEPGSLDGRVADNGTINTATTDSTGDILNLLLVEIGSDFNDHFRLERLLDGEIVTFGDDFAQKSSEEIFTLQASQSGGIGRRDVDHEHVGVRTQQSHASKVILIRIRSRSLVLAEVDGEQAPRTKRSRQRGRRERVQRQWLGKKGRVVPCEIADSGLQLVQGVSVAEGVEAVAVDTCAVFLESEESGLRVSRLYRWVSI